MSKSIHIASLTVLLLALSQGAYAQSYKWYAAFGAGPSFLGDNDVSQAGLTLTGTFDTGAAGYGAVGAIFNDFRAEGELFVSVNDFDTVEAGGAGASASGDVSAVALMANGYYDFQTGSKWRPYVGGGIGFANVSINDLASLGFFLADDDDTVFAYQLKAGIAYQFSPRWEGTLGYRYFGTQDGDFTDSTGAAFTSDGLQEHVVEIGARVRW